MTQKAITAIHRLGTVRDDNLEFVDAAKTSTFNSTALQVTKGGWVQIILNVTAVSGTDPTLDVKVQTDSSSSFGSPSVGGGCDQIDDAGCFLLGVYCEEEYIRLNGTIGGTSPSFTIEAWAIPEM